MLLIIMYLETDMLVNHRFSCKECYNHKSEHENHIKYDWVVLNHRKCIIIVESTISNISKKYNLINGFVMFVG